MTLRIENFCTATFCTANFYKTLNKLCNRYCRKKHTRNKHTRPGHTQQRAAFYMGLKSKVGIVAAKASALRINLNIQGCGVVAPPLHAPSQRRVDWTC